MTRLVLGIDGGGTSTVALCADRRGRQLGRGDAGPANYRVVGRDTAVRSVMLAGNRALAEAGAERQDLCAVWAGLAGVNTRADRILLTGELTREFPRSVVIVDNDAFCCLGDLAGPAVAVIAGTGSIAVAVDRYGGRWRAGGWGHILGDEGSGYDLARRALQAVCRAADGRGPDTALTGVLCERLGISDPDGLYDRIYSNGLQRHELAALAPVVCAVADSGDGVARSLIRNAVVTLADTAAVVAARPSMRGEVIVRLCGGLFRAGRVVTEPLTRAIGERMPGAIVEEARVQPVIGAVQLAVQAADAQGVSDRRDRERHSG